MNISFLFSSVRRRPEACPHLLNEYTLLELSRVGESLDILCSVGCLINPFMICLLETKKKHDSHHWLKRQLHMTNHIAVNYVGLSGGILVLWNDNVIVSNVFSSRNHVDVEVSFQNSCCHITFVYGSRDLQER